jgi:hypothetical protein
MFKKKNPLIWASEQNTLFLRRLNKRSMQIIIWMKLHTMEKDEYPKCNPIPRMKASANPRTTPICIIINYLSHLQLNVLFEKQLVSGVYSPC